MKLPARKPFFYTLFVATSTVLAVWFFGIRQDWSLFKESLIALTILSGSFLCFLSTSLFLGIRVHDNFGNLTDHIRRVPFPDQLPDFTSTDSSLDFDAGEGCGAIILGILAWLLVAAAAAVLLWLFAAIAWAVFMVLSALLYWVFFRALRFALRHRRECRGKLAPSFRYALIYTAVYTSWLYGIVLVAHYMI